MCVFLGVTGLLNTLHTHTHTGIEMAVHGYIYASICTGIRALMHIWMYPYVSLKPIYHSPYHSLYGKMSATHVNSFHSGLYGRSSRCISISRQTDR